MRGRVDAACKARGDDISAFGEPLGDIACDPPPGGGGVARADHGDGVACQKCEVSLYRDDRRRRVCEGEGRRIIRIAQNEKRCAELFQRCHFLFRIGRACDPDCAFAPAARRETGQGVERGFGGTEMFEQIAEGDGADIFATCEPQARQALFLRERAH